MVSNENISSKGTDVAIENLNSCWILPPPGWVRANSNAIYNAQTYACYVAIICRSSARGILWAATRRILASTLEAKAIGVELGIEIAKAKWIKQLAFETNCKNLVPLILGGEAADLSIRPVFTKTWQKCTCYRI